MKTFQLSDAQVESLNKELMHVNTSINNIAGIITISNDIPFSDIVTGINHVMAQHDVYMYRLTQVGSEYRQYIDEFKEQEFEYIDFTNDPQSYDYWVDKQVRKNIFRMDQPLYEFTILTLPEGQTAIFTLHHHMISDAWSTTLSGNALFEYFLYGEHKTNSSHGYLKSIENEIAYKNSNKFNKDKRFWSKKVEDFKFAPLFEKHSNSNAVADRVSFHLSETTTQSIYTFCENNEISLNNLFSSAMMLLKYIRTGSPQVSTGILIHNRNKQFEKTTIGDYARVLPIIMEIDPQDALLTHLRTVKNEAFKVLKHRKYPFNSLRKDTKSTQPLFDCTVSFQKNQYNPTLIQKGFTDKWLSSYAHHIPIGLNVSNRNSQNDIAIDYNYQVDYLTEEDVVAVHQDIMNIIGEITNSPNQRISALAAIDLFAKS